MLEHLCLQRHASHWEVGLHSCSIVVFKTSHHTGRWDYTVTPNLSSAARITLAGRILLMQRICPLQHASHFQVGNYCGSTAVLCTPHPTSKGRINYCSAAVVCSTHHTVKWGKTAAA